MMTMDQAYLCPKCGSPSMTIPMLAGGEYVCEMCNWAGDDPILVPFGNPFASKHSTFAAFVNDFMTEFAKVSAFPLGKILVKWGFVYRDKHGKPDTSALARYLKSMASSMIMALIEERKKIEKEKMVPHDRPVS